MRRFSFLSALLAASTMLGAMPLQAQVKTIDPDRAIDSDLAPAPKYRAQTGASDLGDPVDAGSQDGSAPGTGYPTPSPQSPAAPPVAQSYAPPAAPGANSQREAVSESADTYDRDDLMSAAEGVFGKGAEGLAGILEKILKDQGRPNAYIAGREASGAFVVGLRYGSGILSSKIEGQQPVYWTGPSVGFDVGGDANKVFVLVYNLYDTEELYKRFPAGEGHVYFVGGFSASYLRSGNTVLIPVRLGVGWRAGVNVGYMKFSHHEKWMPF